MCAILGDPRNETERLTLRRPRRDDAVWIADRINDLEVARMLTRVPHPYRIEDADSFLAGLDPSRDHVFLLDHRTFGPIGMVGLHDGPTHWSPSGSALSPELGYWLARSFWGRGLATEAVTAALAWAETALGVRAVASGHFADNAASARVLEKAGFLYTGEVQPRFSLARGEVAPTRMMVRLS